MLVSDPLTTKTVRDDETRHTFDPESADLIKMIAVYVRVHAEQPSHDGAYGILE